jgi:hypothetical protein
MSRCSKVVRSFHYVDHAGQSRKHGSFPFSCNLVLNLGGFGVNDGMDRGIAMTQPVQCRGQKWPSSIVVQSTGSNRGVFLVSVPYQASQRNSKGHRHVIGNRNDEHMWRAASWKNIARSLSLRWTHRAVRLRHRVVASLSILTYFSSGTLLQLAYIDQVGIRTDKHHFNYKGIVTQDCEVLQATS